MTKLACRCGCSIDSTAPSLLAQFRRDHLGCIPEAPIGFEDDPPDPDQ